MSNDTAPKDKIITILDDLFELDDFDDLFESEQIKPVDNMITISPQFEFRTAKVKLTKSKIRQMQWANFNIPILKNSVPLGYVVAAEPNSPVLIILQSNSNYFKIDPRFGYSCYLKYSMQKDEWRWSESVKKISFHPWQELPKIPEGVFYAKYFYYATHQLRNDTNFKNAKELHEWWHCYSRLIPQNREFYKLPPIEQIYYGY